MLALTEGTLFESMARFNVAISPLRGLATGIPDA